METTEKTKGKYTYFFDDIEFTLEIPIFWETIYRGKPREKLYDSYTLLLNWVKKVHKDKYILDLGANYGIFTIPVAKLGYKCVSFEPIEATYDILYDNCLNNSTSGATDLFKYALSDEDGIAEIYIPNCPDNASFSPEAAIANMENKKYEVEAVETVKFDTFIQSRPEYKNIGFIKLDLQGAETKCIRGMSNFLDTITDCYLVAEFEPHLLKMGSSYEELDTLIKSHGFKYITRYGNDWLFYKQ